MESSLPLQFWYVSVQLLTALVVAATGYWVYARTETHHRMVFVGYTALQFGWIATVTGRMLASGPGAKYALSLLENAFALFAVASVGYFATVYTNRSTSPWKPRNAAAVVGVAVGLFGILTQPVLRLQYAAVSYRREPIAYLAVDPGPMYVFSVGLTVVILGASIAYLARLFVRSPHRPTSSVALLVLGGGLSLLPNAVSILGVVPMLPGYDYTVFGTVPLTLVLGYVVFFRGELDLAPMARNEIVDQIDDALFGLDDTGRVVDYNAAARALMPPETDDPVGTALTDLLPALAEGLPLPSDPDGDATTTYAAAIAGTRRYYSVSVSPIAERGTVAGYSVILRDVTDTESARRELERQNRQLESFASTVAHDIRNPLQVADGTSMLLAAELSEAGQTDAVEHLRQANDVIGRIDALLDELQTLAEHAQSVTETESVAFESAVMAAWRRVETGDLTVSVPTDGSIEAEPTRLESILETLIARAVEHGGSTVTAELTATGFTYESDCDPLSAAERAAVFESSGRIGSEVTGLGLKLLRTEIESQGWRVTADGSRVIVSGAETALDTEVTA